MNVSVNYPFNDETLEAYKKMLQAPNEDKPICEMDDETTRDLDIIKASIKSLAVRWRGRQTCRIPGWPTDRRAAWGVFDRFCPCAPLPVIKEFLDSTNLKGTAIDLGCGNSPSVKLLLDQGWHVIAVDNSRAVLMPLVSQHVDRIRSGQLVVVERDLTTYVPDAPVDLVIAADSLPYIDPATFYSTWCKIQTFVKENGFFIGSLFRAPTKSDPVLLEAINGQKEMGAWFLHDRRMVRPLLTHMGYEIKTCKFRNLKPDQEPLTIQFIAQKMKAPDRT